MDGIHLYDVSDLDVCYYKNIRLLPIGTQFLADEATRKLSKEKGSEEDLVRVNRAFSFRMGWGEYYCLAVVEIVRVHSCVRVNTALLKRDQG